jgi:hypothetical protein
MANTNIVAHLTRENVGKALRQMRQEYQHRPRELNAINRAALELEASTWIWDGELLVIQSASDLTKRYHVSFDGCDCMAGKHGRPCKHLAAFHLVRRGAELALTPARPKLSQEQYAAKLDAWNDGLF